MRRSIGGFTRERLGGYFEGLGRRGRRVLCAVAYGADATAIAPALIARPWSVLPAVVLFAACGVAYYPLRVSSGSIDYRAMPREPSRQTGGRHRHVADGVDEAQLDLLYDVYRSTRWFLGSAVMDLVTYPMLASSSRERRAS